jgi:cyclopropane-fatty-acyl-phospholipid synthase
VGHRHLGTYFAACDRLLAPGGRIVLQVITIPDRRYDDYRRNPDWIQRYIFPGGMLPSLTALCRAMTKRSELVVEHLENIGPHYAPTLRDWREAFERAHDRLLDLGYPEYIQRMWRYYFSYCEAGFAAGIINDLHVVLNRPGESVSSPVAAELNAGI